MGQVFTPFVKNILPYQGIKVNKGQKILSSFIYVMLIILLIYYANFEQYKLLKDQFLFKGS